MDRNQNGGFLWAGVLIGREHEEIFWGDDVFYLNPGNKYVRVSKFFKLNTLRLVHFTAYKLYLDKA